MHKNKKEKSEIEIVFELFDEKGNLPTEMKQKTEDDENETKSN